MEKIVSNSSKLEANVVGPKTLNIEISSGGSCMGKCSFCYKAHDRSIATQNMSLDTFIDIMTKINTGVLTQVTFEIMDLSTNSKLFSMMDQIKYWGVEPTYITHGLDMTPEYAEQSAKLCKTVTVLVVDREKAFNAVATLYAAGLNGVTMQYVLSEETCAGAFDLMQELTTDERVKRLSALTFVQYKAKSKSLCKHTPMQNIAKYRELLECAYNLNVPVTFDPCSSLMCLKAIQSNPGGEALLKFVQPCTSSLTSAYINHRGEFFPCSFIEGRAGWKYGIDTVNSKRFTQPAWKDLRTEAWRERLLATKEEEVDTLCPQDTTCKVCSEYLEFQRGGIKREMAKSSLCKKRKQSNEQQNKPT